MMSLAVAMIISFIHVDVPAGAYLRQALLESGTEWRAPKS
jgi:hypothetical protein